MKLFYTGCSTNLNDELLKLCEQNGDECKTCYGINCNSEPSFKACLQCSASDWFCGSSPERAKIKICKSYKEKCYTYAGNNGVSRGCLPAESTELYMEFKKNPDKCEICINTDANSCNNRTVILETCVDCDSNNDSCKTLPNLYKNKLCSPFVSLKREGCYLRIVSLFSVSNKFFRFISF